MRTRTFLFAPGSDAKKAEKALLSNADVIILDLEDAVAPTEKKGARGIIVGLLRAERRKPILVRINSGLTTWALADLLAIVPWQPDGIVVPKASPSDIQKVCWVVEQLAGLEHKIGIYPLIETAGGVEEALATAQAGREVRQLIFGALDYCADVGLTFTGDPFPVSYARSRLAVASAAAGLPGPIDTVYPGFKDEEKLRQDTLEGKKLGFRGKLVIHPAQIDVVNELYSPTQEEISEARQIVEVYEQAKAVGLGSVQWKGKMLDEPVLKRAQQIITALEA